jgi:hypothetical protein
MSQIFHRSTNTISRATIYGFVFVLAALGWGTAELQRSPWITRQGEAQEQPVPFSHQHHVGGLGIDCRYCHTSVENSSFAGLPPTKTCMNCHSQLWTDTPLLQPVRDSYRTDTSLRWTRVHDLPDYVFFNHQIHVNKGVGCATCHGPVDRMPLTFAANSLQMEWCLDCHRAPDKYLRPKDQVFNMRYEAPSEEKPVAVAGRNFSDQRSLGRALIKLYGIRSPGDLTSCSTCHR